MSTNIHQPPSRSDAVAFLNYQIAVMQASTAGQPLEARLAYASSTPGPWCNITKGATSSSTMNWASYDYRIVPPKIAIGHNPGVLAEDQVGVKDGWRLLSRPELDALPVAPVPSSAPTISGLEYLSYAKWESSVCAVYDTVTYRTKQPPGFFLPKPKVKTLRDWLNELPDGYRELAIANSEAWIKRNLHAHGTLDTPEPRCSSVAIALGWFQAWTHTPEGTGFWQAVRAHLVTPSTPLPPLPKVKKLVPWTFDTCPMPGFLYRLKQQPLFNPHVGMAYQKSISAFSGIHYRIAVEDYEHSTDGGKTWNPCGTME